MTALIGTESSPLERSRAEWLQLAKAQERDGDLFRAYDLCMQGLEHYPEDVMLKHRAVLSLASTGATALAKSKYEALGLHHLSGEIGGTLPRRVLMDVSALWARLMKDEALELTGSARSAKLTEAADLYASIWEEEAKLGSKEAYYPAINAATLRLLAGDLAGAERLATITLRVIAEIPSEQREYYELVSALEAHLVLGDPDAAKQAASAIRNSRDWSSDADYRALASTMRQLQRILDYRQLPESALADLRLPRVVHFSGHIISPAGQEGRFAAEQEQTVARKISDALDARPAAFAYGSLAAGADILIAEAFLQRGASLHVVLPFDEEEFIEVSVRPAGEHWVSRYWACRNRAETVRFATTDRYLGDDQLFAYCSELSMGLAVLRAQHLLTEVEQILVWDGTPAAAGAGTAVDAATWQHSGRCQTIIQCGNGVVRPAASRSDAELAVHRQTRAMLFGDVKGFSKLTDGELPRFTRDVLGAFARVIDGFGSDVLLANTWGDGLYLVFNDAGKAAQCALDLQHAMASIDLAAAGLPGHLALRVGGHLGPVYADQDPILKRLNFFGAHVSRAARIEPITPEGAVYVTETFAAALALHHQREFGCEYVGYTDMAKGYGRLRMFLLRENGRG